MAGRTPREARLALLDGARDFAVWSTRNLPILDRRYVARRLAVLAAFPFLRRFLRLIEFALSFLVFALALVRRRSLPCHLDSVTSASFASGRHGVTIQPASKPPMPAQVRCATPRGISRPHAASSARFPLFQFGAGSRRLRSLSGCSTANRQCDVPAPRSPSDDGLTSARRVRHRRHPRAAAWLHSP